MSLKTLSSVIKPVEQYIARWLVSAPGFSGATVPPADVGRARQRPARPPPMVVLSWRRASAHAPAAPRIRMAMGARRAAPPSSRRQALLRKDSAATARQVYPTRARPRPSGPILKHGITGVLPAAAGTRRAEGRIRVLPTGRRAAAGAGVQVQVINRAALDDREETLYAINQFGGTLASRPDGQCTDNPTLYHRLFAYIFERLCCFLPAVHHRRRVGDGQPAPSGCLAGELSSAVTHLWFLNSR